VTRAALVKSGVTDEMIRTALRRGRIMRIRQGVYLSTDAWPPDAGAQQLMRARAESAGSVLAVISRESAAIVWGLPSPTVVGWEDHRPSVSFPAGAGVNRRSGRVARHEEQLPAHHLTRDPEGYAVTRVERTVVDLAAGLPLPEMLVLLDAATRIRVSSFVTSPRRSDFANQRLIDAARSQLVDVARERRQVKVAAACAHADPRRESPAESLSAGYFILADLPAPLLQHRIRIQGATFYPDFLWAQRRLIGECDGASKYSDRSGHAMVQEKQREQRLRDAGFSIVRWLAAEIMLRPAIVVDRVARALSVSTVFAD
jgi:hypothetical protein